MGDSLSFFFFFLIIFIFYGVGGAYTFSTLEICNGIQGKIYWLVEFLKMLKNRQMMYGRDDQNSNVDFELWRILWATLQMTGA